MVLEQLDSHIKNKCKHSLHTFYKNLKWIIDHNVKHKTIKLLEDSTGEDLSELRFVDNFSDNTKRTTHEIKKKKLIKWTLLKLKNFWFVKTQFREWNDKAQTRRKYLQNTYMLSVSKIHIKFLKYSSITHLKMGKRPDQTLTKEDKDGKYVYKNILNIHVIMELQVKMVRYHFTPIRKATIQNTDNTICCQGCGVTAVLIHCWW